MQLTATQEIDAPQQAVFDRLSDFDMLEARLAATGVALRATPAPEGALRSWHVEFVLRGKPREATVVLTTWQPPERMVFEAVSGGLAVSTVVTLLTPEPGRTTLVLSSTLMPQTLSARLLVQSLKLGRAKVEARLAKALGRLAAEIEAKAGHAG